jgi:uncharacterized membrane protein
MAVTETPSVEPSRFVVSKSRLEFLVDGIFAIAMTILVLELKVPEIGDRHSVAELASALAHHRAAFASYLLSFLMLGVFWFSHNQHFRHFTRITRMMLILSLVQLAAAAFFPFCAALAGRYPINELARVIYLGCILVYLATMLLLWLVAGRSGALSADLSAVQRRRFLRGNLVGCVVVGLQLLMQLVPVLAR